MVLEPIEVALLSSKERERVDVPAIGFGRVSAGDVVMLLSFDDTLGSEVEIDHAFLVLEPVEGAPSPFAPVPIEVAPILEEWSRESVSWGRRPEIGLGEKVADAAPRARRSLRVEVTRMIEETRGRHGIAVLASGQDPIGAFYATGLGRGTAPRLELYLKPTEPAKPAPSASTAPSASAAPKAGSPAASASADEGDDVPAPRSTPKRRPPVPKKPASHR